MSPPKRRTTLADVAREAGVSVTTASYILNGRAAEMRIRPPTQERVESVAQALAYRPNRSARSLRTRETRTIGLVSDHIASGSFASRMLSGAGTAARELEHLMVIGESEGYSAAETALLQEMVDREVDGIVFARLVTAIVQVPTLLRQQRAILLNSVDREGRLPCVVPDEVEAGRVAARLLAASPRTGPIVIVGRDPNPIATAGLDRTRGACEVLVAEGREVPEIIDCDWTVADARGAVARWLGAGGRATGYLCLNDRIAMGTYQTLWDFGLAPPHDCDVVSFDASDLAQWLRPSLTSVAVPYAAMGAEAVRLLLAETDLAPGEIRKVAATVAFGDSIAT